MEKVESASNHTNIYDNDISIDLPEKYLTPAQLTHLDNDAPVLVGLADALPDQRHDLTIALAAHA